ncbi:hypothetical protein [Helicobacter vulpis]|uniref:hypothetical protein n=1 Tax=Helicobacter vulpis TaxID=2316076 RepID=UPI000EAE93E5|nr:hypothetical protein [Helicobacter vulpis]
MFQPLLDAFVDSARLPLVSERKPLTLGLSWWWGGVVITSFKTLCFDHILNSQYAITYATCQPCDIAFGALYKPLSSEPILKFPQKRIGYTGENEHINFDIYDFGMGFDHLSFHERYLRVPLYYVSLWGYLCKLCAHVEPPFQVDMAKSLGITPTTPFQAAYPNLSQLFKDQRDPLKREFASFVASNPNAPMRNAFYQHLKGYRPVGGGGGVQHNRHACRE